MSDISHAINRALRHNSRYEGYAYIDRHEARDLAYRAGDSALANEQLRQLRHRISRGSVGADRDAVHTLDRQIAHFDRRYGHDYRRAPMTPMPPPPRCERSAGGVVRDGIIGSVVGGVIGGILGGEDGADVGAVIGGVAGATRSCD